MKYTIEDLRNGNIAVENDGTLEELGIVLKSAYQDTNWIYLKGVSKYYWMRNGYYWCNGNNNQVPKLPIISVKDLLPNNNKYPKVMWVSGSPDMNDKLKRVVFMEKCGGYLAWSGAETLEKAEAQIYTSFWEYAEDIEELPVLEITMEDIAEKYKVNVEQLKIIGKSCI